ncbi:DUF427 domain-containing protein [Pseudoprimorskyibacter insulae]|uniref:DUF427 domain-containing protein n=1 Tax=Pseudoprimorskyibacter insulae TaxID=1695997 RepID=A0A2R8AXL9_9RHOB|nr:DUF427 domain-containing protein [Pseudoprimorskyibacter insulae]SPF80609.1 hypothetical protein PRI8871_02419 [Pseudoprimorskyibacter insulae]
MTKFITIRPATGTWVVRAGGAVLCESNGAMELTEGDLAPVIYFPRGDIAMAFLDPTDQKNTSAEKGEASYFSIVTKSETLKNAAWTYESPVSDLSEIKGYIAFNKTPKVAVEQL